MNIPCVEIKISSEQAGLAACEEHPDILTRIVWLVIPGLRQEPHLLEVKLFYCKYYIAWGTVSGPRGRHIRCAAAMNSALNLVRKMVGSPQTLDREAAPGQIAQDRYTSEQAEEKLKEFMVRSSYKSLRGLGSAAVEDTAVVYRPFYECLCEKKGRIYRRVVDAVLGERDYLLEYQYKNLSFPQDARESE